VGCARLDQPWFYYYAEADDGSYWAGEFVAEVSQQKFHKCTCPGHWFTLFWFIYETTGSYEIRLGPFADRRMSRIAECLADTIDTRLS
jgi:hypothetical protein